ncbi:ABC transporter permease [Schumannella sp. 10F1B-5-1]|uniref:ABC transporter permease n=1 Tax=Schumannella sp. 10F1B-5-1 TaxID=2590780 RepID=UPI0011300806|nr:ABC transporter permease [Schumannella sp. 10F1B-5-1]TPW72928.1 ABC transporter permease [Schumannella sp. 10F1B-5-1]
MTAIEPSAGPASSSQLARERAVGVVQSFGAPIVLAIVVIVAAFSFPTFFTVTNLTNILLQSSFLLIVAIGMTFVIVTGGIDLSVGSVFALGGVLAAYASQWGWVAALVVPLVVGAVIGVIQGALVAWGGMAPFIVTLAGLLAVRGIVLAITNGGSTTPLITDPVLKGIGQGGFASIEWPVVIGLVLLVVGIVLLTRSRTGQGVIAVGGSENASTLMGLPVARVKLSVYVLSGLTASLAGALNAAYTSSGVPVVGVGLELSAISAVVIGGTLLTGGKGSLVGTLAGVLLLGVIQNVINQVGSLTSSVQSIVSGGFLAVVVIIQTVLSRQQRL